MTSRFDFHLHSSASDGARAPGDVLRLAREAGFAGISITDHDTIGAYDGLEAAAAGDLRVLPGIEVSASRDGMELHILGYFPGGFPEGLRAFAGRLREERRRRIQAGINKLGERGVEIGWAEALAEAGGGVVSRGHLAQILLRKGYIPNIYAAFPDLLGPAIVPPPGIDAGEVVREILRMGGIPVWAHPMEEHLGTFLPVLVEAGLVGFELHTGRRRPPERKRIARRISGARLVITGGSDWHGGKSEVLGRFSVTREQVGEFLGLIGW